MALAHTIPGIRGGGGGGGVGVGVGVGVGSGVARVAQLGGQAGGKGLLQGGKCKRIPAKPEGQTAYRLGICGPLKAPRS